MKYTIQHRRGTTAQWDAANPVLGFAEIGIEKSTEGLRTKVGDGTTTWTSLPYIDDAAIEAAVGAVDHANAGDASTLASAKAHAGWGDSSTLAAAKAYTGQQVTGLVGTEEIEPDEVQVRFDDSPDPILRISPERGIIGTRIEHEPDTIGADALVPDVRDRVMSVAEIPEWMGWDFAFRTQDGHVVFGRRSDGEWVGADGITGTTLTPTTYVAYGDSTTQGTGVDGVEAGWVDVLRDTYDVNITNKGLSGARAEEITALMGGLYPTAEVSGGTIPASGGVNLTGFDIDMVRAGSVAELNVDLITEGNQVVRGRIYKTGTETRQFSRTTPGDTIPAQGRVELSPIGARAFSQSRIFLGQGINNEQNIIDGEQSVDDLIAWYASAAAILPYPIVVWGMLDRGVGEAVGTPRGDIIAALEAWLPQRFGADFWPVRQYLASAQALTDAVLIDDGYEPTEDDLTAQAANTVPPSFRTGPYSVHLNDFGHQLQARYMYRQMLKRGWL